MNKLARLRWQCRRGSLELDLWLESFLDKRYPELEPAEQAAFESLLEQPDPTLMDWLFGRGAPPPEELARIVEEIRRTPFAPAP